MARLWMAGAEVDAGASTGLGPATPPDGQPLGSAIVSRDTSVFRSGLASWKFDSGASLSGYLQVSTGLYVAGRSYFFRSYVRAVAAPGTTAEILVAESAAAQPRVRFRTDGALELVVSSAVQGSPSLSITDSNWHRVELGATLTSTTWTSAELRLDGATVATWSGSQTHGSSDPRFGWHTTPGASVVINFDDYAVNDSTGTANTTWCGPGAVVLLVPAADSAVGTGWTNDNAATSGLFNSVKNTPPTGIADTTAGGGGHQIRNATSNANVNYDATMTTYTAAGVGASDTVNAVQFWAATAAPVTTSAKSGTVGIVSNPTVANIALANTGLFWSGAAAGSYGTGWIWTKGTVVDAPTVTLSTAPVMRVTQVTASTRIAMVCSMTIYVDYTAAAAAVIPDVGMALIVT